MKAAGLAAGMLIACAAQLYAGDESPVVVVVVGAEGTEEYGRQFRAWAARWEAAAKQGGARFAIIGLDEPGQMPDRELLTQRLAGLAQSSNDAVWLILIGHGTFDGKTARFNLRGPDITPAELAAWLKPIERPLAIVNCASASGPFLSELSGNNRVVITATRSGFEYNFARLGDYLSASITDTQADLNKDEQTSLLEAFLRASAAVTEFYEREARLATEHALLDDNGDSLGTPADWFQGLRAVKTAKDGASLDGTRAGQFHLVRSRREEQLPPAALARRDEIERELALLRQRKGQLPEEQYLAQIEPLLTELAHLYEEAEKISQR
jgi:hypothetical protein